MGEERLNYLRQVKEVITGAPRLHKPMKQLMEMDHRKFGGRLDLPSAGADTEAVLGTIGYNEEEIRSMQAAGIVAIP